MVNDNAVMVLPLLQIAALHGQVSRVTEHSSRMSAQTDSLQLQLDEAHRAHTKQNEELQSVLYEAQMALQHLRGEKACTLYGAH